jgi:hypothetical protein
MKLLKTIFPFLFSKPLSPEEIKDIEFVKNIIIKDIKKAAADTERLKEKLRKNNNNEIFISVIYLKMFSASLQEKKFSTVSEGWKFMEHAGAIFQKIMYVNHFLLRIEESKQVNK